MAYLRLFDYYRAIQDVNLQEIISADTTIRLSAEVEAQAEAVSYLKQKYNTDKEFTDTLIYSPTTSYKAEQRVEINYSEYLSTSTYAINDCVIYLKKGYVCTHNGATGSFNPSHWTLLGDKYDLYYVTLPKKEFNYIQPFVKGEQVYWKDKIHTAQLNSPLLDHQTIIQYESTNALPYPNVFPDDPVNGVTYWGAGTSYSVNAGVLPTDTTKWTKGDNRSVQLVHKVVDICLYNLHTRIAPRNIPQLRMDRYAAAIAWLDMCKDGQITADIPINQPVSGKRIRWSSQPRNINNY